MALTPETSTAHPFVSVLYGSAARGDSDNLSDIDILIIDDDPHRQYFYPDASVVRYEWSEIAEMKTYGSLFLRHLRQHSRILDGNIVGKISYTELLEQVPSYARVKFDLNSFEIAIDDCAHAVELQDTSADFEMANIATVMRHCSILGCYLLGADEFSRTRPIEICCEALKLDDEIVRVYRYIYLFRIALMRGHPLPSSPQSSFVMEAIRLARVLILGVKEHASLADLP